MSDDENKQNETVNKKEEDKEIIEETKSEEIENIPQDENHDDHGEVVESLQKDLEMTNASLKKALADYQNYKRRVEEEKKDISLITNSILLRLLLDVLDDFELLVKNVPSELKDDQWKEGLTLIFDKLKDVVFSQHVELLEVKVGDLYNPATQEVIGTITGENANSISQVVRNGYKIGDKIIRPARVIVVKN
jgi:molecular chaperone GrpE